MKLFKNANLSKDNIPDNPKAACAKFLNDLEKEYYPWYSRAAARHIWWWNVLTAFATLSGFVASVYAAVFQHEQLTRFVCARIALIVLPTLASLASTFLVQMRISELIPVWERGRREFQKLIAEGLARFAAASSPGEYTEINKWLVKEADTIELEQTDEFVRGLPGVPQ